MPANTPVETAAALVQAGKVDEAARLLHRAASSADADALYTLALWRISGHLIRHDLAEAGRLMRAAGEAGSADAQLLYAQFLASGTGGEADWVGSLAERN